MAIYDDEGDPTGEYIMGGFQEYANDEYFDYSLSMSSSEDVVNKLWRLGQMGVEVTEVYFYDHCESSYANEEHTEYRVDGLQFGATSLYFEGGGLSTFALKVRAMIGDGVRYHFRNCFLGTDNNKDRLMDLAEWFMGEATGVNGWIVPRRIEEAQMGYPFWNVVEMDKPEEPDYFPEVGNWKNAPLSGYTIATYDPTTGATTWGEFRDENMPDHYMTWY